MKSILGAGVLIADIIAGMAAPAILANLHKHPHANAAGAAVIYGVLALASLWVIMSLVRPAQGSGAAPAPRSRAGYPFGGGR